MEKSSIIKDTEQFIFDDSGRQNQQVKISVKGVFIPDLFFAIHTSHTENWKQLASIVSYESSFYMSLPVKSVTTFVGTIQKDSFRGTSSTEGKK